MSDRLKEIAERAEKATPGPWEAWADGSQFVNTRYLPTARSVACSRIRELTRPWNPHALIAFGFSCEEYEVARFLTADAEFIAHARQDVPFLLNEVARLQRALDAAGRREMQRSADD
jgi:hypothetical protein